MLVSQKEIDSIDATTIFSDVLSDEDLEEALELIVDFDSLVTLASNEAKEMILNEGFYEWCYCSFNICSLSHKDKR